MALRASSAAESPLIYVLLSESSRFKSGVCGQATRTLCVFGCERKTGEYESPLLSANTSVCLCVCAYLSSDTRTNPNLPAGCLALLALEGLHLFDGEYVWKIFFRL